MKNFTPLVKLGNTGCLDTLFIVKYLNPLYWGKKIEADKSNQMNLFLVWIFFFQHSIGGKVCPCCWCTYLILLPKVISDSYQWDVKGFLWGQPYSTRFCTLITKCNWHFVTYNNWYSSIKRCIIWKMNLRRLVLAR